ncbi:G-type lectin S-receptor-like serine/threonine-protein kinase At1g11330 [Carya illinoinensis]|uniref:G-type lectin S-receptor-like serine/threonine-protein kinase At1g11330 n=1 Tax=Carya illinoinensis TaxID=32201 RepID=UPI001C71A8CB|nr:G-type lectin S-receptor-like serine/threonine-protein kinase At1g11330 [Carya illinoinensis]
MLQLASGLRNVVLGNKRKAKETLSFNIEQVCAKFSGESKPEDGINQVKLLELPIFSFEDLSSATNNFHQSNKLGQGGFGPVYRGKLLQGQEIAVKRLSRASGQGLEEFMNEVVVISKLQHRNLVRLLGGCVEGEENLLIYEYMPNKSLDVFLFG